MTAIALTMSPEKRIRRLQRLLPEALRANAFECATRHGARSRHGDSWARNICRFVRYQELVIMELNWALGCVEKQHKDTLTKQVMMRWTDA
jgi:hypothetical protein